MNHMEDIRIGYRRAYRRALLRRAVDMAIADADAGDAFHAGYAAGGRVDLHGANGRLIQ